MKWLGLTGGIASGKSTVHKYILESARELQMADKIKVIDADSIVHDLFSNNHEIYQKVVSHFGSAVLNPQKQIDRKLLGTIVFDNKKQLKILESIVHPAVQDFVKSIRAQYHSEDVEICFYDVPLLFEKNLQEQFDKTILVYAPLSMQIERLMSRNKLSHLEALARIKNQISIYEKVAMADLCLDNSTDVDDLVLQIQNMLRLIVS